MTKQRKEEHTMYEVSMKDILEAIEDYEASQEWD